MSFGRRSLDELAVASDLSVTTLRRFLDDGELSMPAAWRSLKLAELELEESFADSGKAVLRSGLGTIARSIRGARLCARIVLPYCCRDRRVDLSQDRRVVIHTETANVLAQGRCVRAGRAAWATPKDS